MPAIDPIIAFVFPRVVLLSIIVYAVIGHLLEDRVVFSRFRQAYRKKNRHRDDKNSNIQQKSADGDVPKRHRLYLGSEARHLFSRV